MEERDDYDVLSEQMFRKAFGTEHNAELKDKLNSGDSEFTIEHYETMKNGDEMAYRIHFTRSEEHDNIYMKGFFACLIKDLDAPGQVKEHFFEARQLITAAEAYRLLKYDPNVAVNKNLFKKDGENKEKYNIWISVDTGAPKDENGNYPLRTFHEKYYGGIPFNPSAVLQQLQTPVREVQSNTSLKSLDAQLRKANIVSVKYDRGGEQLRGFITINPGHSEVILHDENMMVIEKVSAPKVSMKKDQGQSQQNSQRQTAADEKKKPWQQQGWNSKKYPGKGMKP